MKCQARRGQHPAPLSRSQSRYLGPKNHPKVCPKISSLQTPDAAGSGSLGRWLSGTSLEWEDGGHRRPPRARDGQDGSILQITGLSPSNRQHIWLHVTCKGPRNQTRSWGQEHSLRIFNHHGPCRLQQPLVLGEGQAGVLPTINACSQNVPPHLSYPAPRG